MAPRPQPPKLFPWPPNRNSLYFADLDNYDEDGNPIGEKPFVVISNNARNQALDDCLALRITTTPLDSMPSRVPLSHEDKFVGTVVCDDIITLYREDIKRHVGTLSPGTMRKIDRALFHVLSLTHHCED